METKLNVDSTKIQEELDHLWEAHPEINENKACLFNLIVYTHEPHRTHYFKDIVARLMSHFPCRVFFIENNPTLLENYLRLHLSILKSQNELGIACEQFLFETAGEGLNRIPFLILPLFVSDLPIYLLWGQDPISESTLLPHLESFASRIIFDSEASEDLQHFSEHLLKKVKSSSIQIVDMNWARIKIWREALAQTFDGLERFKQLQSAFLIKMIYNEMANDLFVRPETQALYLQTWLASRLGWQFKGLEKADHSFKMQYQDLQGMHEIIILSKSNSKFAPEEILEIEVSGADNYVCHLNRKERDFIEVHAYNQFQCELPFTLFVPNLQSTRIFMQEILYQRVSDHYLSLLEMIRLIWRQNERV